MSRNWVLAFILLSTATAAAQASRPVVMQDACIFDRIELGDGASLTVFGVIEDTRCATPTLCFEDDRSVIDTVLKSPEGDRKAPLAIGTRYRIGGGSLVITGSTTPPNPAGPTRLTEYRFAFVFIPDGRIIHDRAIAPGA